MLDDFYMEQIEDEYIEDDISDFEKDSVYVEDSSKDVKGLEEKKESGNGQKSINSGNYFVDDFKNLLINNFGGGAGCSFEIDYTQTNTANGYIYIIVTNENQEKNLYGVYTYGYPFNYDSTTGYYISKWFDESDNNVGISVKSTSSYNITSNNSTLIITPKTGQSTGGGSGGSSVDYTEYLEDILDRLENIEDGVSSISENVISSGGSFGGGGNTSTVSVNHIMDTPVKDYNLSESLVLFGLVGALIIGCLVFIGRSIIKWN